MAVACFKVTENLIVHLGCLNCIGVVLIFWLFVYTFFHCYTMLVLFTLTITYSVIEKFGAVNCNGVS